MTSMVCLCLIDVFLSFSGPVWKRRLNVCEGKTSFNNSCYQVVKPANWFDAVDQCKSLGGTLVSLSSSDEVKLIIGNITNASPFWLYDTGQFSFGELFFKNSSYSNSSFNGTFQTIMDLYGNILHNASVGNTTTNGTLEMKTFNLSNVSGNGTSRKIIHQDGSFLCPVYNEGYIVGANCSGHLPGVCELPGMKEYCKGTRPKTPHTVAGCQSYRLVTIYQQVATNVSISSSCNKSVKIRLVANCHLQICYNLLKQFAVSLSTCNKFVDNLQQTCRQQAVAIHTNAS